MEKYNVNFGLLNVATFVTIFLGIAKFAGWIDISTIGIFIPIFIALGIYFLLIFFIGLVTCYLVIIHNLDKENESENKENESDEQENDDDDS